MENHLEDQQYRAYNPWLMLAVVIGFVFAGIIVFNIIGMFVVMGLYGLDSMDMTRITMSPELVENARPALLIMQGIASFGSFVVVPLLIIWKYKINSINSYFKLPEKPEIGLGLIVLIMFSVMLCNSIVIEWNRNLILPESLQWFENIAKPYEEKLERITIFLTDFENPFEFILALVIVAGVAGVGEELLFRGLLQTSFVKITKNPHIGIWLTGFLFAAFHMQFYGLVPRMLLGVVFGYLYHWSGKLSTAMFAHFLNNAFMVVMVYLFKLGVIDIDLNETEYVPNTFVLILFFILTAVLLTTYKRYYSKDV
ncbi:MAG: CPBP family intramembrane metalloprotease [Cyclobacteriaceae bacterium]